MKKLVLIAWAFSMVSCLQLDEKKEDKPTISESLPISDRQMLLEPMEWAMDDLVRSVDENSALQENFFSSSDAGVEFQAVVKTEGKDTFYMKADFSGHGVSESHVWYFDKKGNKVISTHSKLDEAYDAMGSLGEESIKYYYEETGTALSVYQRLSIGKAGEIDQKNNWEPFCPGPELQSYLEQRKSIALSKMKSE